MNSVHLEESGDSWSFNLLTLHYRPTHSGEFRLEVKCLHTSYLRFRRGRMRESVILPSFRKSPSTALSPQSREVPERHADFT